MDVQDVSTANGGNIQQWTNFNAPNQQFRVIAHAAGRPDRALRCDEAWL